MLAGLPFDLTEVFINFVSISDKQLETRLDTVTSTFEFIYLLSCTLFNDDFSVTKTTQCLIKGRYVKDELQWIWKEAAVA
jgi:hypothetical protein